jgi:hypothetical protein
VKALTARRIEKITMFNKLFVFSLTLTAFMAAWLLVDNLRFSFLGLSDIRVDQLIEFVRVLSSAIGLYMCIIGLENRLALSVLESISQQRSPKASLYYKMSLTSNHEGLIDFAPSPQAHVHPSKALERIVKVWSFLFLSTVFLAVAAAITVNIRVLYLMWIHPAIGPFTSRAMVVFAALCDVVAWTMVWFANFPLPMSNRTELMKTKQPKG